MGATITERHEGIVTSVEDEDSLGRIKCTCPGITGDEETELPFWLEPAHDWGWFYLPDVDEVVEIEVVVSSPQDEIFGQTTLEAPNPRWRSKRFYNEDHPIHPDFTAENYGKRRGWATPTGHIFIIDDEANTIRISWMTDPESEDSDRNTVLIDEESIKLIFKEKHQIVLEDTKVTVTLDEGNALTLEMNEADATAKFGDGAAHVAVVEHLKTLYEEAKSKYDDHTHMVPDGQAIQGTGNLGAPVPITNSPATAEAPTDKFPDWESKIESTHISIPDES